MKSPSPNDVTQLLRAVSDGDEEAMGLLLPVVYDELRDIARRQRRREVQDYTLSTTALVHEAYIKLVDQTRVTWQNRAHFFAIASQSIRRIIIDHARHRLAQKRGGGWMQVPLEDVDRGRELSMEEAEDFVALDEALTRLAQIDPRQSEVVTYRFFGGLSVEETAEVLDLSPATIKREWSLAKAWLHREVTAAGREPTLK